MEEIRNDRRRMGGEIQKEMGAWGQSARRREIEKESAIKGRIEMKENLEKVDRIESENNF